MSTLKGEAISLIETIPEEYMAGIICLIKSYIYETEIDDERVKVAKWQADPDKYEDEINEFISGIVKEYRREKRLSSLNKLWDLKTV